MSNQESGEQVFNQTLNDGKPDVNMGHRPATAPVNEFGGKNPKDYVKTNPDGI